MMPHGPAHLRITMQGNGHWHGMLSCRIRALEMRLLSLLRLRCELLLAVAKARSISSTRAASPASPMSAAVPFQI